MNAASAAASGAVVFNRLISASNSLKSSVKSLSVALPC
jgi:hypothetical protein